MKLGSILSKVPGNNFVMITDYFDKGHYADGTANDVISKTLDYNMKLRNSQVYGIGIVENNILGIEVLAEK